MVSFSLGYCASCLLALNIFYVYNVYVVWIVVLNAYLLYVTFSILVEKQLINLTNKVKIYIQYWEAPFKVEAL